MKNPITDTINLHGVSIPIDDLFHHFLITGATGSGKTTLILSLLRQLLSRNADDKARRDSAVIFDVKGDLLKPVQAMLTNSGRDDLLIVGPGYTRWNPLAAQSNPMRIANSIVNAAGILDQQHSTRPEELFWAANRLEMLCVLVELAQVTLRETKSGPLRFQHLQQFKALLSQPVPLLAAWAKEISPFLSENGAASLVSFSNLPDSTRACVQSSVSGVLSVFAHEPLSSLVNPIAGQPHLDPARDLFQAGKVVVVTAGHVEHATEMLPLMMLLKQALFGLVLSRPRLEGLNQERPLWIILDEFTRTMSSNEVADLAAEHVTMEMARSSRTGFVLATNSLSCISAQAGATLTEKLAGLCRNMCFFATSCPQTHHLAQRTFGNRRVQVAHRTVTASPPPPLLLPGRKTRQQRTVHQTVLVPTWEPIVAADQLARLPTGAAVLKLSDGSTHELRPAPGLR